MKYQLKPLVFFCLLVVLSVTNQAALARDLDDWQENDAQLVGRISHAEGYLSRFDPETDKWVSTTRESPFGTDDLLRTDVDGRAEFILPNNTWARIDGDTRIQLLTLTPQITDVDLSMGNARFYNKSTQTEITATTPFGRVTAPPGATFDLYVDERGVDLVAIQDSVFFYHNASRRRHEVRSDSSALFADMQEVTAIAGDRDPEWTAWNKSMDTLWAERMATRGQSAAYLPSELYTEAYALDRHGHWERVYYDGRYYRFWRPVHVSAGWSPFSWGAWIVWHGDHVWIPHEPFGYVTCHYGNWIFTAGHWYWAPPVTRVMVRAGRPLLHIGFGWYPGRVSWIHSGAYVGWIPLAPFESYYTHSHWGRRSIAASKWKRHRRHTVYKHRDHAVVIHRSHLYRSDDYRRNRIRNISRKTINTKFRSTHLLGSDVLMDHRRQEKRERFYPKHSRRHRNTGPAGKIRSKDDHGRYARHFGVKHRLNPDKGRTAAKRAVPSPPHPYERKSHAKQAAGKTSTATGKRYRSDKKPRPHTSSRYQKHEASGAAVHNRRNHQSISRRPVERRKSISNSHERNRAKNKIRSRRPQPQAHHWEGNRNVQKNTTIRPNRRPGYRTARHKPAAVTPPAVHRQPPKAIQTPTSISPRPQEPSRRQWHPTSNRRGNGRNASEHFRGGGGRHRN